jgi:hypothetical protein
MLFSGSQRRRKHRLLTSADQTASLPLCEVYLTKDEAHSVPLERALPISSKPERQLSLDSSSSPTRRIAKWRDSLKSRRKLFKNVGRDTNEDNNMSTSPPGLVSLPRLASQPAPTVYVSIPHSRLSSGSLDEYLCADRQASEPILDLPSLQVVN